MLEFLRKYQRYFYLVITVIIIISFSFFGTYSTLGGDNYREQIAFTAVDGTPITRGELDHLVLFIGTDAHDKLLFGGTWGPNFLNDGVIVKDFLQTGLGKQLAAQYPGEIAKDLDRRLEKERRFKLYSHPQIPFIGVEGVWNYFAPDMKMRFDALRGQIEGASPQAFEARAQLYLAERQLPAPALHQILRQQQRQFGLQPDLELEHTDLSLFGYHTLDDWFGPRFLRLAAEYVINSAKIAEKRGIKVSNEEALADLMHNGENSYRDNLANPNIGVANSAEYFNEQLHRLSLDPNKAAHLWRQVLLFRRLYRDVGQAIFVDPQSLQPFNTYAQATVEGALYSLPKTLRFNSSDILGKFETYLNAVSKRDNLLDIPSTLLSASVVSEKAPELVQKRYLLDVSTVNKELLQARVGIKETWNWEEADGNWPILKQKFPDLSESKDRMAALDALDEERRSKVDAFARRNIVDAHPEWLEKALQDSEPKRVSIAIPLKGGKAPFAGLKTPASLIILLDRAKKGEQDPSLADFSEDRKNYYKIVVVDRSEQEEIMTFEEALQNEALVGQEDLKPLYKAIYDAYVAGIAPQKPPRELIDAVAVSLRFYPYMNQALLQLKKNPEAQLVQNGEQQEKNPNLLPARQPLQDQWKLVRSEHKASRSDEHFQDLFSLSPGAWSRVQTPVNGDLFFFHLDRKGSDPSIAPLDKAVRSAQELVADEAKGHLSDQLLEEMKLKNALSLDFLNVSEE